MAGGLNTEDSDIISDINVTPFVDVALVLLIIFMVTSVYIVRAAMEVELPRAASAGDAVESTLNIVLTKEGELLLNGESSTHDGVAAFIRQEIRAEPKLQAVIAADKSVAYGEVVRVIDLVKLNGVKSFALNIERATKPRDKGGLK